MSSAKAVSSSLPPSHLQRWLREPLLHFLLIGLVMCVVYHALHPNSGPGDRLSRIELTADDLRQLQVAWAAKWQRPPGPEELRNLVAAKVREEILYREGLALGLDKEDTIVKRRLAQKVEFLSEDVSTMSDPGVQELKAWFEKNASRFALPSRVTFRHLYFSFDGRGERSRIDATRTLAKLAGQPADSPAMVNLADPFMYQSYYADRTPEYVANVFGTKFALALLAGLRGPRCGRTVLILLPAAWLAASLASLLVARQVNLPAATAAVTIALGALVAADLPLPLALVAGCAMVLGFCNGRLNGLELAQTNDGAMVALGMVCSLCVVMSLLAGQAASVRAAWTRVAVRVAGSWIAAAGLFMLGWAVRGA